MIRRRLVALLCSSLGLACVAPLPAEDNASKSHLEYRDASNVEFEEYCRTRECRGPVTIKIVRNDGTLYESHFEMWPPLLDDNGFVNMLPGETINLLGRVEGDQITDIRVSELTAQPKNGIHFQFWQDTSMSSGSDMLLRVVNTFDRPVKFDLDMMTFEYDEVLPTSSCPVYPGRTVLEHWPHAIFQLFVGNFRFIEESDTAVCE